MTALPRLFAFAFAASVAGIPAFAAEEDYLARYDGAFSGGGMVLRNGQEQPNEVTCNMTGRATPRGISMSGQCGAAIFQRAVSAELRYDPKSGVYSGTYVGSHAGPARLVGKRKGDSVVLTITWPKPINGDTKATMTIRNSGNGSLAITVTDKIEGQNTPVTRIALRGG